MTITTTLPTCPRSGLQFEANAEADEPDANAVAAVVFLLIGGILAIGVVLTRWPASTGSRPTPSTRCSRRTASTC